MGKQSKSIVVELSNDVLDNLEGFENHMSTHMSQDVHNSKSGLEHYRLLSYLSIQFNNTLIYDIGSRYGGSALALAFNKTNKVKSFDIEDQIKVNPVPDNLEFIIESDITKREELNEVSLIMLDVDPHNGDYERVIMDHLIKINWQGIILLDDTDHNNFPNLRKVVADYTDTPSINLTKYGHFSGTTCFNFSKNITFKLL